jgi:site-specific recombinase XerD
LIQKEIAYLWEQEVDAFFRMILSPRDKALFRLIYHHGLRASEPGKLMLYDFRQVLGNRGCAWCG